MKQTAIVILTPGFPENEADSSCLPAFQQFALALKKHCPEVVFTIVTLQYPFRKANYVWHSIPVIAIGGNNKGGLYRVATWFKTYRALQKLHQSQPLSGIISLWLGECALVGHYFSRLNRVKQLIWVIGQDAKPGNRYVARFGTSPQNVAAMSDFLKDELYRNYKIKALMVVENGINPETFPAFNNLPRKWDVLGAGWLTPLKNYGLFVDIIYELKKTLPGIQSAIIGSGEEEAFLRKKINALGLVSNVTLLGLMPHSQVLETMNNARTFLHTSHYEGNSTVLMEALYCGCYVVSTQPLSSTAIKNLTIGSDKDTLVKLLLDRLTAAADIPERVVFNTMDDSARKIMQYFT